jgi:hypothetical protein
MASVRESVKKYGDRGRCEEDRPAGAEEEIHTRCKKGSDKDLIHNGLYLREAYCTCNGANSTEAGGFWRNIPYGRHQSETYWYERVYHRPAGSRREEKADDQRQILSQMAVPCF